MITYHPDYPDHPFELQVNEFGTGLIITWDLQCYTVGVLYAIEQGWTVVPDDNGTVKLGSQFQVRITKSVESKETEVEKTEPEVEKEEEVVTESQETEEPQTFMTPEEEVAAYIDLFRDLENTKENRKKIDEAAKEKGIELDRRKLQSVDKLVAEFEKQLNERK